MGNQQGLVKCAICEKEGVSLQGHIRLVHKLTCSEYKAKYNAPISGQTHRESTNRSIATRRARYGNAVPAATRIKGRKQIDRLIKAGTFSLQRSDVRSKALKACYDKFGGRNPMQVPEIAAKNHSHTHQEPNKYEKAVMSWFPELTYTGNFTFPVIASSGKTKYPDFVCGKQVVEVFGDFWHSYRFKKATRVDHVADVTKFYADCGFDCCIVWASEIHKDPEATKQKISRFLRDYQSSAAKAVMV